MWCLLPLAVLLLLSISPTETEVVQSMSKCVGFLLDETPPQVTGILNNSRILNQNRYKIICQTHNNTRRFLTLYDTTNKIPVFSAYKYRGGKDNHTGRPNSDWKMEPQVRKYRQASNDDYKNTSNYDRGHLFPSSYGFDKSDKVSTFTLTNVVPQAKSFNQGSWSRMEQEVKKTMDDLCYNNNDKLEAYVMTGAQPSQGNKLKNRVNVPSMLWTAFCCYSHRNDKWIASAYSRDNVPDKAKDHINTKTLQELYNELNKTLVVFPGSKCL
uniref:Endonuclease domain-containing 1 protein-like n=1 Tax=Anabas testudineus TaxID=64144 RepID=A0A3Q1IH61_ANATE